MVLLTMTPAAVDAISRCRELAGDELLKITGASEPSLDSPSPGNPVSHAQLIEISKLLKSQPAVDASTTNTETLLQPLRLSDLLQGSRVYTPPPKPRAEPSLEYKHLMARLRQEEELRSYERMLNPLPEPETFARRFGATPNAHLISSSADRAREEEDELTYADINRQLALIINVLISIIACSVALWMVGRYWSTPKRLALSMTGSIVVAIAEVAVYGGYLRRVKEAKQTEQKKTEVKEIIETWTTEEDDKESLKQSSSSSAKDSVDTARYRKGKHR